MTPQEFAAKWQRVNLTERSAAQQHFLDLCDLLGQPKPAAADPDGAWYTFERGVRTTAAERAAASHGWADVWMREHFAWEYKGKHKDLAAAYQQLQRYREDLDNPPRPRKRHGRTTTLAFRFWPLNAKGEKATTIHPPRGIPPCRS